MSGSCLWIVRFGAKIPKTSKPDFGGSQKIIFQAASGGWPFLRPLQGLLPRQDSVTI
jgi:hypothetical protein